MNINCRRWQVSLLTAMMIVLTVASSRLNADTGSCGGTSVTIPFTDVTGNNLFFCAIAEAYVSGLTNGTSATTYSPAANVPREQMAAFITRTLDQSLRRGSRRAALRQWTTPTSVPIGATTTVGNGAVGVESDGEDIWVANQVSGTVSRVRCSDGKLLETWTGASVAFAVLVARGRVYVVSGDNPGHLYKIDPRQPAGAVALLATVGPYPRGIATDGYFIWVTNSGIGGVGGSVSKVNPDTGAVQTFTLGFSQPFGILNDGTDIWVTDASQGNLFRLNDDGSIAQTIYMNGAGGYLVFDGTNIWVPAGAFSGGSDSLSVVRAETGVVVATLSGNGLNAPINAAFDGQRILVTNFAGSSVSLWRATDLKPLGSFSTGANTNPYGACSDGINFWITSGNTLARF